MPAAAANREFDFIVFGASGFTGQYAVEEMARTASRERTAGGFKWAVAGRSEKKLRETLSLCAKFTKMPELESVPVVVADVSDSKSLTSMTKRTRVLLSCVGPYRFFGEPVVQACIDSGTHCLDVCGEPQFLESMQLKYDKAAKEAGVLIVGSCGWDSVPVEVGLLFTERSAPGRLNSAEAFYKMVTGEHGAAVHYGTWQSAVQGFAHRNELGPIRKQLFPKRLPKPSHRLVPRSLISFSKETNEWCVPFPGSDRSVVMRTQRHLLNDGGHSCLQFFPYMQVGSLLNALLLLACGTVFGLMASFGPTRRLLEAHPRIFSLGLFSHQGPTRQQVQTCAFAMTFVGIGWKADEDEEKPPTCRTVTRLKGPEPGYIATPICLIQSGLCVLTEAKALPKGGVFTPGAAFRRTSLIERLSACGFEFTKLVTDSATDDSN